MNRILHSRWFWALAVTATLVCVFVALTLEPYRRHRLLHELELVNEASQSGGTVTRFATTEIGGATQIPGFLLPHVSLELRKTWFVDVQVIEVELSKDQEGLTALQRRAFDTLREVRRVRIFGSLKPEDFLLLSKLPNLEYLSVFDDYGRSSGFERFQGHHRLDALELHGVQVTRESLDVLRRCTKLRSLEISGDFEDEVFEAVVACLNLKEVSLGRSNPWTGRLEGRHLGSLRPLTKLNKVAFSNLDARALDSLPALPLLREISIHRNIDFPEVERLGRIPSLVSVEIHSEFFHDHCSLRGFHGTLKVKETSRFPVPAVTFSLPKTRGGQFTVTVIKQE